MVRCLRNMLSQPSGAFIFCISTQPPGTASVLCLLGSIQWSLFSARRQGRPRLAASNDTPGPARSLGVVGIFWALSALLKSFTGLIKHNVHNFNHF